MSDTGRGAIPAAQLAHHHVPAICDAVGVSDAVEQKALQLAARADWTWPINRGPTPTAAACVYLAGGLVNERATQAQVADAAGTSTAGLRAAYQELVEHHGIGQALRDAEPEHHPEAGTGSRLREYLGAAVGLGVPLVVGVAAVAPGARWLPVRYGAEQVAETGVFVPPSLGDVVVLVGLVGLLVVLMKIVMVVGPRRLA